MKVTVKKKGRSTAAVRKVTRRKVWRRKPSDFARIYGSKERVTWVQRQPCVVDLPRFSHDLPIENVHVVADGMGRKAGATKIVPMCVGHHQILHVWGIQTFQKVHGLDLDALAAETEAKWQSHLAERTA